MSAEDWRRADSSLLGILAVLTGHDGTYGSTVYTRQMWGVSQVRPGERFLDVLSQLPNGRMMVDYSLFHDTVLDASGVGRAAEAARDL